MDREKQQETERTVRKRESVSVVSVCVCQVREKLPLPGNCVTVPFLFIYSHICIYFFVYLQKVITYFYKTFI